MARFIHIVVASLNFLSLLWSILIILLASYSISLGPIECYPDNPVTDLVYGIFSFLLSLVALIGAKLADRRLLFVYACMLVVWIIWLTGLSTLLFVVSKFGVAKAAKDHKEYQLNEYPAWLRRYAVDGERWVPLKKCMVRDQICKKLLLQKDQDENGDLRIEKSAILYSCCQPPLYCGFVNKNDTSWEVPKSGPVSKDPDCNSWRNNLDQVCYDCSSCKAGYIRVLNERWRREARSTAAFDAPVVIGFILALWAIRQAPRESQTLA